MRQIRDILRLYWKQRLTMRQIARSVGIGLASVSYRIHQAEAAGLGWPLGPDVVDVVLEGLLYPGVQGRPQAARPEPDWAVIDTELRRKDVTLELLWIEYKRKHPEGYQYSWSCERYHRWHQQVDPVLRQTYRAEEKLFVDYAGRRSRFSIRARARYARLSSLSRSSGRAVTLTRSCDAMHGNKGTPVNRRRVEAFCAVAVALASVGLAASHGGGRRYPERRVMRGRRLRWR